MSEPRVIVIGTGPAGGMSACRLASLGVDVLVLEQARLPRHKPCGGGIPEPALSLFDWDVQPFVERRVTRRKHLFRYERPVEADEGAILMVDRARFDQGLVERAVSVGRGRVELRDNYRVSRVAETDDRVRVFGPKGEVLEADYVIAADGAFGVTARSLGALPAAPVAIALDAEIEVTPEVFEQESSRATFNFFCLPDGYGWIFPKREVLSCGVGAWRGHPRLQGELDEFLARSFPEGSIRSIRRSGHVIPIYQGARTTATRRICLTGDAAAIVDPVLGEGIRVALMSGRLAADVVAHVLGAGPLPNGTAGAKDAEPLERAPDCLVYADLLQKSIGDGMAALERVAARFFLDAPEVFYAKFIEGRESYGRLSQAILQAMSSLRTRSNVG